MTHESWIQQAESFDNWYSDDTFESRVPYFGKRIQGYMVERLNKALLFSAPSEGKTILDLGCGTGRFAVAAAVRGATVHAYDIASEVLAIGESQAHQAGVSERCHFHETDITKIDFPAADVWLDLGCLQYIQDIQPVLQKLKHVPAFYSVLPRRNHWMHPIRLFYRTYLKGNPYYTYSDAELHKLFNAYPEVHIQHHGLVKYITSAPV